MLPVTPSPRLPIVAHLILRPHHPLALLQVLRAHLLLVLSLTLSKHLHLTSRPLFYLEQVRRRLATHRVEIPVRNVEQTATATAMSQFRTFSTPCCAGPDRDDTPPASACDYTRNPSARDPHTSHLPLTHTPWVYSGSRDASPAPKRRAGTLPTSHSPSSKLVRKSVRKLVRKLVRRPFCFSRPPPVPPRQNRPPPVWQPAATASPTRFHRSAPSVTPPPTPVPRYLQSAPPRASGAFHPRWVRETRETHLSGSGDWESSLSCSESMSRSEPPLARASSERRPCSTSARSRSTHSWLWRRSFSRKAWRPSSSAWLVTCG